MRAFTELQCFTMGGLKELCQTAQAGQRGVEGAAAYVNTLTASSGNFGPSLQGLPPHYGTRAAQRAADSLLEWLQGQTSGPASLGGLGFAASRTLGELTFFPNQTLLPAKIDALCNFQHLWEQRVPQIQTPRRNVMYCQ